MRHLCEKDGRLKVKVGLLSWRTKSKGTLVLGLTYARTVGLTVCYIAVIKQEKIFRMNLDYLRFLEMAG